MGERREIDLGDILTVVTDKMFSPHGLAGLGAFLQFLVGEEVYNHQFRRVMLGECRPWLLAWHPQLREVDAHLVEPATAQMWLAEQIQRFGKTLVVEQIPPELHERIDPESELVEQGLKFGVILQNLKS